MNVNFFCEKHGKNNRDAHFSNISKFVKSESLVKKLETSQDLVDAIIKRQSIANDEKIGMFDIFKYQLNFMVFIQCTYIGPKF